MTLAPLPTHLIEGLKVTLAVNPADESQKTAQREIMIEAHNDGSSSLALFRLPPCGRARARIFRCATAPLLERESARSEGLGAKRRHESPSPGSAVGLAALPIKGRVGSCMRLFITSPSWGGPATPKGGVGVGGATVRCKLSS